MRNILAAIGGLVVAVASVSAQSLSTTRGVEHIQAQHEGQPGPNYLLTVSGTEFNLAKPAARIAANPLGSVPPLASHFSVRCWRESDHTRVVVFAIVAHPSIPARELETPIATFKLAGSDRVIVSEMTTWGAVPMVLRLVRPLR